MKYNYISGNVSHADTIIPLVSTNPGFRDLLGAIMVRWGWKRENYRIEPGLYGFGTPSPESDVFVTANYKLSFDNLRKSLGGISGWILVLDTKGVNVWCAAGKGTFSTKELVNRIKKVSLEKVVSHRRLVIPQLGATGVAAYKVKEESGFNVHFGPVRAKDLKVFLRNGYRADKIMRKVTFGFHDRIKLIPNDFMYGKGYLLGAMIVLFLISSLNSKGISFNNLMIGGLPALLKAFLAYFAGIVITPVFLPYLPGRYFSLKGFFSGCAVFIILLLLKIAGSNIFEILSWFLVFTSISSFIAMNFTGSSTFTSLSGVKKEMKISIPFQIGFAIFGIVLMVIGRFI